jgi:beta-lactamase class A
LAGPDAVNQLLDALNKWLHAPAGAQLVSVRVDQPETVVGILSAGGATEPRARVRLTVTSRGMIADLDVSPAITGPVPATWADVDAALRSVAPQVQLLVADVTDGTCRPVHGIDPDTPAPFGSVLKIYVLHALGEAVAAGKVRWDQPLTITAPLKSLPSGVLQFEPDGTQVTVLDAATEMISVSDNTATDMLIDLVGRPAVEAALTTAGMADPSPDRPFLTTRETFILTLEQRPELARRYLAADEAGRRALLADTVDRLPLPDPAEMRNLSPTGDSAGLGWFASAGDICRAYTALAALARRPGLAPIDQALSLDDDILELDPSRWATTWRKGGVGPGALAMTYRATTRTGQSYVVAVVAEDPSLDGSSAGPTIMSAMKGAFDLAAGR